MQIYGLFFDIKTKSQIYLSSDKFFVQFHASKQQKKRVLDKNTPIMTDYNTQNLIRCAKIIFIKIVLINDVGSASKINECSDSYPIVFRR